MTITAASIQRGVKIMLERARAYPFGRPTPGMIGFPSEMIDAAKRWPEAFSPEGLALLKKLEKEREERGRWKSALGDLFSQLA